MSCRQSYGVLAAKSRRCYYCRFQSPWRLITWRLKSAVRQSFRYNPARPVDGVYVNKSRIGESHMLALSSEMAALKSRIKSTWESGDYCVMRRPAESVRVRDGSPVVPTTGSQAKAIRAFADMPHTTQHA